MWRKQACKWFNRLAPGGGEVGGFFLLNIQFGIWSCKYIKHIMIHVNNIKPWQVRLDWFDWFPYPPKSPVNQQRPADPKTHRIASNPWDFAHFLASWRVNLDFPKPGGWWWRGFLSHGGALLSKKINQDAPQRLLPSRKPGKHVVSGNFPESHLSYSKGICDRSLEVPQTALQKGPQGRLKVGFLGSLAYIFSGVWRGIS